MSGELGTRKFKQNNRRSLRAGALRSQGHFVPASAFRISSIRGLPNHPVNPNESLILGEKCYARLEDIPEKIDIVDIFRRSELVPEVADAAIRIGARAIWNARRRREQPCCARLAAPGLFVLMEPPVSPKNSTTPHLISRPAIPATLPKTPVYRARQEFTKVHNPEGFLASSLLD